MGIGKVPTFEPVNCDTNGPGLPLSLDAASTRSEMVLSSSIKFIISIQG